MSWEFCLSWISITTNQRLISGFGKSMRIWMAVLIDTSSLSCTRGSWNIMQMYFRQERFRAKKPFQLGAVPDVRPDRERKDHCWRYPWIDLCEISKTLRHKCKQGLGSSAANLCYLWRSREDSWWVGKIDSFRWVLKTDQKERSRSKNQALKVEKGG